MTLRRDRDDRVERLTAAAAKRSADAESRARRGLIKLQNSGQPISFTSVARAAAVSTSFLYQHDELRDTIMKWRGGRHQLTRPMRESASPASLRAKLSVAIARNRVLSTEVAALRAENQSLRSALLEKRAD